jgi:hypothetical protein
MKSNTEVKKANNPKTLPIIKKKAILKEVKRLNRSKVCSNKAVASFFTTPASLLERYNEELNKLDVKHGRLILSIESIAECRSECALFYISRKHLRDNAYGDTLIDNIHLATYREIALVASSYLPISINLEKLSDPDFKSDDESVEKVEVLSAILNVNLTDPICGDNVGSTSVKTGHMMLSNMAGLVDDLAIPLAALAGKTVKSITYPFEAEDSLTAAFNESVEKLKGKVTIAYDDLLKRRERKVLQPRNEYALG